MGTETVEIKGKQIVIKRFDSTLIPKFVELFQSSFKKSISHEHVARKYETQNLGGSYIGHMAFHNGLPIAYYGVLPVPFVLQGDEITAVQSADTMTHPEYRRHGLFPLLATKTYELAKSEGASFVFGWPNQNSYPSFKKKLGWIDLGNMIRFTTKVSTIPLAKISVKLPMLRKAYLGFFKKIAGASNISSAYRSGNFIVPRHSEYLDYKESLGAFELTTEFGSVIASLDHRLKIGDLSGISTSDMPELFDRLRRVSFLCGIDEILIIEPPQSKLEKVLTHAGFKASQDLPLMYWPFKDEVRIDHLNLTSLDYDGF